MSKKLLFRLFALVAAMMCALGASAAEAYANINFATASMTFYYDNLRSTRTGKTYDLNGAMYTPDWYNDGNYVYVEKVSFDSSFAVVYPRATSYWFAGMTLRYIYGLEYLNTSAVTNMKYMFHGCKITGSSPDLSHFNTANVTNMNSMFSGFSCFSSSSLDLSSFNTANVTDMDWMFYNDSTLTTITVGEGWNTDAVTTSYRMFLNCTSLVGGKGTTYDANHVDAAYAHIDDGTANPGYLTDGREAYANYTPSDSTLTFYYDNLRSTRTGTTYDLNTGSNVPVWYTDGTRANVTKVDFDPSFAAARPTSTYIWFSFMSNLTSITGLNYLNTSNVTDMYSMFKACIKLTSLDLSGFNTANVTNMDAMFNGCTGLTTLDLSSFNTANVTNMSYMFCGCSDLTSLDVSNFNTSKVKIMSRMFCNCSMLTTIYAGSEWNTDAVTSSYQMFYNCPSLVGGLGTTYDANHTDAEYAHIDGGTANPGYLTDLREAYACYTPSNTTLTFYYDNLRSTRPGTTYDLNTESNDPDWYTDDTKSSVTRVVFDPSFAGVRPTSTYRWFGFMKNLQTITGMKEYLNTEEVKNMYCMFYYCSSLTSLDVSNFNTANVTNMQSMFMYCKGLTTLDLSSFNTAKVINMQYMFAFSNNLTSLDLSSFNTGKALNMYGVFYQCTKLATIYGSDWNTTRANSQVMFKNCTSLVGGMGTTYDADHVDIAYAHIDGGPSNPGYFTEKPAFVHGDVNSDGFVNITDVTALINYLLTDNASGVNLTAADCSQDGNINITDVTVLINYLLTDNWN